MRDIRNGQRQLELGSSLDFQEVAPGIYRMGDQHVYAHDGRTLACPECGATGKVGRGRCFGCRGKGKVRAIDVYCSENPIPGGVTISTFFANFDELREWFVANKKLLQADHMKLLVVDCSGARVGLEEGSPPRLNSTRLGSTGTEP
jgi:hypothetical protein